MYNKLFTKILDSSIWLEPTTTRIVWLTLIAGMDEDGFVALASVANLAHRARVTLEEAQAAVATLESPDENSSDPDHEGRRIERVTGGWMVLNSPKYRDLVTRTVSREQTRMRVAKHRAKKAECNGSVTNGNGHVTQSEADTNSESPPLSPTAVAAESFKQRWNSIESPFPKILKMTAARMVSFKERMKNPFWRENFEKAMDGMLESDFLKGSSGWIADVDFFLRPDSVTKILEGKYRTKAIAESPRPYSPNI